MKKLFVMSAIVLGTVAFSACDSKPAAETTTESTEMMSTDTATMMSTDTTSTMMSTDSSAMDSPQK